MKIHQRHTDNIYDAAMGIGAIAAAINAIKNATGLLTYRTGTFLICLVILAWTILSRLSKSGKLEWITRSGISAWPRKWGIQPRTFYYTALLVLMLPTGYDFFKNGPIFDRSAQSAAARPVFHANTPGFNIFIMPFLKECDYEGKKYDIGLVLKKRLENMGRKDSLDLHVYYDSVTRPNFNEDSAGTLMQNNNAHLILSGSYSLRECESDSSDKICFNYQTNAKKWDLEGTQAGNEYKMTHVQGLDDVRKGAGQENIDYIIYWVTSLSEFRNKNYARAISMLEMIKDYQQNETVLFQLSNCYYLLKDYHGTKALLEKVLQIDPNHEEATLHMSGLLINQGKMDSAKILLERVAAKNPDNINVLRDLTYISRVLKDTAASDIYLKKLLAALPEIDGNLKDLGAIYKDVGNYEKAKEFYERAFRVCSRHADDWNPLGLVYLHLGDTVRARSYFVRALAINSHSCTALYNLGILLQKEKNFGMAEEYLQRAEALEPLDPKTLQALGSTYQALKKKDEALESYEKALSINKNDAVALFSAAVLYMEQKNFERADPYLDRFVNYYPDNIEILNKIGNICSDKDNYKQAFIYYKRLLKLVPGHGAVYYNLASTCSCQHDQAGALRYLAKAVTAIPKLKESANTDKAFDWLRNNRQFMAIMR